MIPKHYIDQMCNELASKIEDLRRSFKIATEKDHSETAVHNHNAFNSSSHRERELEAAIQEAVAKLASTKKSFKSRKVKEVRESLIRAITSQGHFACQREADQQECNT